MAHLIKILISYVNKKTVLTLFEFYSSTPPKNKHIYVLL